MCKPADELNGPTNLCWAEIPHSTYDLAGIFANLCKPSFSGCRFFLPQIAQVCNLGHMDANGWAATALAMSESKHWQLHLLSVSWSLHHFLYQAPRLLKYGNPNKNRLSDSLVFITIYPMFPFKWQPQWKFLPGLVARSHGVFLPIAVGCGQGGTHIV